VYNIPHISLKTHSACRSTHGLNKLILLTGATGYIGGRLLQRLERQGLRIRCLARRPNYLRPRVAPTTEVVQGDVLDFESLEAALHGVHTAYYLVHSMGSARSFVEEDRRGARNFAQAAQLTGVQRIVYLGGLGPEETAGSPHLKSRREVGDLLRESGIPVVEFRASIVIGSGSLSFELVRALVERLPAMVTPRWVSVPAQPIAITDLLSYLTGVLELEFKDNRVFEIGGREVVSYRGLMREYAAQRGLRRLMIPVPVLTPGLSSLWLGLVTPVYARVGRMLIESIRYPSVVNDKSALEVFDVRPMSVREAISQALRNEDEEFAHTRWSDALSSAGPTRHWGGVRFGIRLVDSRSVEVMLPPPVVFAPISRIGGSTGWYFADWLWRLRGFMDLLVGGVGIRRGRSDASDLRPGDTIDWWRVEMYEPGRRLLLSAEMKLPGRAWLEFEVEGDQSRSVIRQTAMFDPVGVPGLAYWYLLYPIHNVVFGGMLRGIARAAARPPG
jgi:uncharacterized protein YbjT (DUF2867 family)